MTKEEAYDFLINMSIDYFIDGDKMRKAIKTLKQEPCGDAISRQGLINDIDMAIKATNMNDEYSCGMRNGMRLIKSFIDDKKPEYEKCCHEENKSEPDAISFKVDGDVVLKYEYMFGSGEDDLTYKTNVVMTKEIFQECYEKWIKPDVQIVCGSCACRKKEEE